jgi:hypothetical protein
VVGATEVANAEVGATARTVRAAVDALHHDLGEALDRAIGGTLGDSGETLDAREAPESHEVGLALKMRRQLVHVVRQVGVAEGPDIDDYFFVGHVGDWVVNMKMKEGSWEHKEREISVFMLATPPLTHNEALRSRSATSPDSARKTNGEAQAVKHWATHEGEANSHCQREAHRQRKFPMSNGTNEGNDMRVAYWHDTTVNSTAAAVVRRTNGEIPEKFARSKQILIGDAHANNHVQYREI